MSGGGPLISLDGFAKPVTVLIERISNAIGILYRPKAIVKEAGAKAEAGMIEARGRAEAMKILAGAESECLEIQDRALMRLIHEETKKQENIESIIKQALPDVKESAKPENIDDDWLSNYFDKSKGVSNPEMQSLWAKILAGEANSPGSFSRRTVNLVASLGKEDAQSFTSLCAFVAAVGPRYWPLVFEIEGEIYAKMGINFSILTHLSDIGLVTFNGISTFDLNHLRKHVPFHYFDKSHLIELSSEKENRLSVGFVKLTMVGLQLVSIAGGQPSEEVYEYFLSHWKRQNFTVWPLPDVSGGEGQKS